MILTRDEMARVADFFIVTLGIPARRAGSVWGVLAHGNRKHANDKQTAREHLEHALVHLDTPGRDEETGEHHAAHAAARSFLAMVSILRNGGGQ